MARFSPPPGTADIFPDETGAWLELENAARRVFSTYNYGELRTPIFEYTEVFQRGLGDETEVVRKEMYTFQDRGGRSLTLRPEGTAGVMRSLLNTDVLNGTEQRVFYMGPMFRGERPAAGRRRQFHQVGAENVGRVAPGLDAEAIAMLMDYLEAVKISGAVLKLNTRGIHSDRGPAGAALKEYFGKYIDSMCEDCKQRFNGNIWRILDCKQEHCREIVANAPDYVSFFSAESRAYFDEVCQSLTDLGIAYEIDPLLVRGLDYYVHTVFEVVHSGLGAQTAIAGGGRYELLLPEQSRPLQGVGFAAGMERLLLVREALNVPVENVAVAPVFLAGLGAAARRENLKLAGLLRRQGIVTAVEVEDKSLKSQMRSANRLNARIAVIRGDDELAKQVALVRNFATSDQEEVPADKLLEVLMTASGSETK